MLTFLKFVILIVALSFPLTLNSTSHTQFSDDYYLQVPPRCIEPLKLDPLSSEYRIFLEGLELEYELPSGILFAIMLRESSGDPTAVSRAGAEGLFQFMPNTSEWLGINPYDPRQAGLGAAIYLEYLLTHFNGRIDLTIAAYNAGMGNVRKYGNKIPPFRETQNYVLAIKQEINYYNL